MIRKPLYLEVRPSTLPYKVELPYAATEFDTFVLEELCRPFFLLGCFQAVT